MNAVSVLRTKPIKDVLAQGEADGSDGGRVDSTTTQSAAMGRERPPPEAASAHACLTPP